MVRKIIKYEIMKKNLFLLPALLLIACTSTEKGSESISVKSSDPKHNEIIKVVEYFDFGCGHCKKAAQTMDKIKAKYGDVLEVELRHFALSPKTFSAAEAAECGRAQGKFKPFHDSIFQNFGVYTDEKMKEIAQDLNLDQAKFNTCFDSGVMKSKVRKDQELGRKIGVSGTPYFVINGKTKIPGAISEVAFGNLIDKILEAGKKNED